MLRIGTAVLMVLLFPSCSVLSISRAPKAEDHRYDRRVVRDDPVLRLLGDHRCISWQGWDGDTIAVAAQAVDRMVFIGPPLLPLVPFASGYGGMNDGAYGGEVNSADRLWVSVLLVIAPGHTFALDPCAAEWVGGKDALRGAGMVRTDGTLATSAYIPLAYRCDEPQGTMYWRNTEREPQRVFLMLRFLPGIHLEAGAQWTLRLPCLVNGNSRAPEFRFHYGQWINYVPISKVNG